MHYQNDLYLLIMICQWFLIWIMSVHLIIISQLNPPYCSFVGFFLPSLGGWREYQGWGGVDRESSSPVPLYPGQCSRTMCHSGIIALQNLPGHCSLMFCCYRWSTVRRVPWGTVSMQGCTKTWTGSGGCSGRSSRDWFTSTNKSVTSLVLYCLFWLNCSHPWTSQSLL